MSSVADPNVIQADGTIIEFDRSNPGLTDPVPIFTVPLATPARIEAVFCLMDTGNQTIASESLVLFMQQANGDIIWVGPSPTFIGQNVPTGYVSWGRGNQESAQFAAYSVAADDDVPPLFSSPALPDIVLPAQATLAIAYNNQADTNTGTLTIRNLAVTYTPGAGPTSVTDSVQGIPLLTDVSTG